MNLTCPHCGYSRELPEERRPSVTVRVTCPRCREHFQWAAEPAAASDPSAALPARPVGEDAPRQLDIRQATTRAKAGFWVRLVAALVDSTLVAILQVVLSTALVIAALRLTGGGEDQVRSLAVLIAWVFGPVIGVAYYVGFTGYCGQTPGKMAIRVKVIRCDGGEIGYGRAFIRETLGKFLSFVIFGIGYLMIAFDGQKQGLHDKLADTYVIKL